MHILHFAKNCEHMSMKTIDVSFVRKVNILQLVEAEAQKKGEKGALDRFATSVKADPNYLSSVLRLNHKRGPGPALMRRIEARYRLDSGSLDFPMGMHKTVIKTMVLEEENKKSAAKFTDHLYNTSEPNAAAQKRLGDYIQAITEVIEKDRQKQGKG